MFYRFVMLKIKKLSEVVGRKVFTDNGDFFGVVEELNLLDNKIDGWRIVVARSSAMSPMLGGARGIIVPHQFVKAIGDVIVISRNAIPVRSSEDELPVEQEEMI